MGRHEHGAGANSEHISNHRKVHHHHHDNSLHRARSLSPHRYRKHLSHNQPHRQSHHHHHHHRGRSPEPPRHRSSPHTRRRSPPSPRPDQEKSRRHRRRSLSPRNKPRIHHHRRRRASSSDRFSDRSSSLSPSPRGKSPVKGTFAKQILKLLSSSKKKKISNEVFDSSSPRDSRNGASRSHNDLLPLILAREELNEIANATMARRPYQLGALQRAREDEALEVERLRKIRDDAAEAERLRISTAEAAERARRTRIQMEMDEAEMRRVRAMEQFSEAERQRREMQIEDRLRQLEDQDMPPDPQKRGSCKKYCRAFKVSFGIFLSLGLIFVFYLIVASIMGESAPLDIFNFEGSDDPLLIDMNFPGHGKDFNGTHFGNSHENHQFDNSEEPRSDIESGTDFDNVVINPYDTSRAYSPEIDQELGNPSNSYDSNQMNIDTRPGEIVRDEFGNLIIEPYESDLKDGTVIVEYLDDSAIKNEETVSVVDLPLDPDYIIEEDQQFSPSIPSDTKYLPPFIASGDNRYSESKIPVNFESDHSYPSPESSSHGFEVPKREQSTESVSRGKIDRSDTSLGDYDYYLPPIHVNGPIEAYKNEGPSGLSPEIFTPTHTAHPTFSNSFESRRGPNRRISFETIGGGGPTPGPGGPRRRPSLEKLESEIIETLLDIAEKDKLVENRQLRVRPGAQGRLAGKRRRPNRRRMDGRRRLAGQQRTPPLMMRPPMGRPNLQVPPLQPGIHGRIPGQRRFGNHRGPRNSGIYSPPSKLRNSKSADSFGDGKHRGPRNSETHKPPPEFRYPKTAENIQDIISHMTGRFAKPRMAYSRSQRGVPKGFKFGDQDHVLRPTFVDSPSSRSKERRFDPRNRGRKRTKPKTKSRSRPKPRPRLPSTEQEGPKNKFHFKDIHGDEVIFNEDGSVVHISNKGPPLKYGKTVTLPSDDTSKSFSKEYRSSLYPEKPKKESKVDVTLDVYPKPHFDGKDKKDKYESKYYITNKHDDRFRERSPIHRDDFHRPDSYRPYNNDRYDDSRYRNTEHRPPYKENYPYTSRDRYTPPDYRRYPDDRYRNDDKHRADKDRTSIPEIETTEKQHTITLHINLYDKKPKYDKFNRRMDTQETKSGINSPKPSYETKLLPSEPRHPSSRQVTEDSRQRPTELKDRPTSRVVESYERRPFSRESEIERSDKYPRRPEREYGSPESERPRRKSGEDTTRLHDGRRKDYDRNRDGERSRRPHRPMSQEQPSFISHGEPPQSEELDAMKELGLDISLNKKFSALDVYRALVRNTKKDSPNALFLAQNGGSAATGLVTPKLVDTEDELALINTIDKALTEINPLLPREVQFDLTSTRALLTSPTGTMKLIDQLHSDDFDYTDGFEAIVDTYDDYAYALLPTPLGLVANYDTDDFSSRMGRLMATSPNEMEETTVTTTTGVSNAQSPTTKKPEANPILITLTPTDMVDIPTESQNSAAAATENSNAGLNKTPAEAMVSEANAGTEEEKTETKEKLQ